MRILVAIRILLGETKVVADLVKRPNAFQKFNKLKLKPLVATISTMVIETRVLFMTTGFFASDHCGFGHH